jgi:hypothetical protein
MRRTPFLDSNKSHKQPGSMGSDRKPSADPFKNQAQTRVGTQEPERSLRGRGELGRTLICRIGCNCHDSHVMSLSA